MIIHSLAFLCLSFFIHKMHGFRGLSRDSFFGGWWCNCWRTYGNNFYTFGPLSFFDNSSNDGIWSSRQIIRYGLWPKFFDFVPTFYSIGTIDGILTHRSDCVSSHSSHMLVCSIFESVILWKFKSLEQKKIALELKKADRMTDMPIVAPKTCNLCNFQTCWIIKSETCHNARFALFDGWCLMDRWRLPYCWLLLHPRSS